MIKIISDIKTSSSTHCELQGKESDLASESLAIISSLVKWARKYLSEEIFTLYSYAVLGMVFSDKEEDDYDGVTEIRIDCDALKESLGLDDINEEDNEDEDEID